MKKIFLTLMLLTLTFTACSKKESVQAPKLDPKPEQSNVEAQIESPNFNE